MSSLFNKQPTTAAISCILAHKTATKQQIKELNVTLKVHVIETTPVGEHRQQAKPCPNITAC